jgi:hypothetical protein
MPKSAIINVSMKGSIEQVPFKKLSLFFDHMYVHRLPYWLARTDIEESKNLNAEEKKAFLSEIDWLVEKEIIKIYSIDREELKGVKFDSLLEEDVKEVDKTIQQHIIPDSVKEVKSRRTGELVYMGILQANNGLIFKMEDIRMRIDAAKLGIDDPATQFVPILHSFDSYHQKQSPDLATQFILSKIPSPDSNTPWEQLLDFRSDEDVKRKYYALLNWLNETGKQDMPVSHLADKFNYLYSEYVRQYSLHKLTSEYTMIELLLLGGMELASSILQHNFLSAFKGLLTIRKQQVALLKEEKNIEGRELGYIFSANEKFKS